MLGGSTGDSTLYNFIMSFTSTQDLAESDFLPYTSCHGELYHVSLYAEVYQSANLMYHTIIILVTDFPSIHFHAKKEKKSMSLLFVPQNKINFLYVLIFCFLL